MVDDMSYGVVSNQTCVALADLLCWELLGNGVIGREPHDMPHAPSSHTYPNVLIDRLGNVSTELHAFDEVGPA